MKKIDDAAFEEGRKLFRKRKSLRTVVEPVLAGPPPMKAGDTAESMNAEEARVFSRLLGFLDAAVDKLRGP